MDKKINTEEAKKVISIFKELHEDNTIYYKHGDYRWLKELDSCKDNDENDKYFSIFRNSLVNYLESNEEKLPKENSFIRLIYGFYEEREEELSLKIYLEEIVKNSKSFFEYFLKLFNFGEKEFCKIVFSLGEIDTFCSKYFYINFKYNSYLIDIKEIEPKEYWHPHKEEKELFREIDNLWSNCKDRDVTRECRGFLTTYLKNLRGKVFSENKQEKRREIENVIRDLISVFKIDGLYENLNEILLRFKNIRNLFGKKEEPDGEEHTKLLENFKKSPHKSINTRLLIDLLKALHNALIAMEKMRKENLIK